MSGNRSTVAIPASIVSDTPHLREKTAKLGVIARYCSIFSVDQILIYADGDPICEEDFTVCEQVLRFLETPQYLRKRLFTMNQALRYVGVLPPLQIPSHNVPKSIKDCRVGDLREGVVLARDGERLKIDVGLEGPVECLGRSPAGTRATVRVISIGKELRGELVDRSKISIYWGYRVRPQKTRLGTILEKEKYDLRIGTSRYGQQLKDAWSKITEFLSDEATVMIAFGSPKLGLREILQKEEKSSDDVFDVFVNMVPNQKTLTVRTEEAVAVTLATLNIIRSL